MTPVVMALIIVNVAVFIWEETNLNNIVYRFGLVANATGIHNKPIGVHQGQWYRLLTAPFLHASIEHILFNMVTLAIVGPPVEAELGKLRFLAIYLVSALGGSVASYLLSSPNQLGVGASGAIFGVMGAYFVLARRRHWPVGNIVVLIVLNLFIGFSSTTIDWRAHIGGLVSGAVVTVGLVRSADVRLTAGQGTEVAVGLASTLGVVAVLGLIALLPPGHVNL
jgi:membrane associated rhomboid family serine protease